MSQSDHHDHNHVSSMWSQAQVLDQDGQLQVTTTNTFNMNVVRSDAICRKHEAVITRIIDISTDALTPTTNLQIACELTWILRLYLAAPIDVQCFYTLCVGANFTLANLVLRAFWGRISGHTANVLYLRHVSHELISYLGHSGHTEDFLYLGQISHEPKSYLEPNSASIWLGIRARSRQSFGYHPKLCQFLNWQSFG